MKDVLLITPPFTQLNTPYPATAYLKGFLNTKNISAFQVDLGIDVILALFTKAGLTKLFACGEANIVGENAKRIFALCEAYIQQIEPVIAFLQGKQPTFARQLCTPNFLPQASRFEQLDDLNYAFGNMGMQDKAKHLATLFLEDLSDFIVETVDENFGFSRYAERLGRSANSFEELYQKLQEPLTFTDEITLQLLADILKSEPAKLVCFSVPFPGNLYSAFRCAQFIKKHFPAAKTAMGGGFPNTELRSLKDVRVFEFFDFITLDDGELPIELLVENVGKSPNEKSYKRTFLLENDAVVYQNTSLRSDYRQAEIGTPDYSDLPLREYISVIEIANPMHSLWSDGRWNKLTMAHGCYWGKCTFCDVSLDYIKIYEPIAAAILVDRMEQLMEQTGESGFHFVDEAAPPALMREVALEILRRKLIVTWWTNIRFEKSFSADLCKLLQASGCIAVSGGLEVASDRLLALIKKGVTVEQVAKVTRNFTDNGIMVHVYLMYGFPTQTVQETVDSLEMVRQLFEQDVLQSGFWHQFALTAHSPIGLKPEEFGIAPDLKEINFANNDVLFTDPSGIDHEQFSYGLKKSLYNYMHGLCFDLPLQTWFDFKIPKTSIPPNFIEQALSEEVQFLIKPNAKMYWIGSLPNVQTFTKTKKGSTWHMLLMRFNSTTTQFEISLEKAHGEWLLEVLRQISVTQKSNMTYAQLKIDFEKSFDDFELFWYAKPIKTLRENGLVGL